LIDQGHELLGKILKEAREEAGLTQRELAAMLDRSQAFVWKIEKGIQHIDIPTLLDVAKCTNQSPEKVLKRLKKLLAAEGLQQ
jgi:transcriptional regulator with XRE-family HTH domain